MAFELARSATRYAALGLVLVSLTACAGTRQRIGGVFGDDTPRQAAVPANAIGVNGFLWRATLDTLAFMPLASADPFGGVIITDWYTAEETPNERFKANVFILDRQLRSTGVQAKLFKQVNKGGRWVDAEVTKESQAQMEDAILTRARQLRHADLQKD